MPISVKFWCFLCCYDEEWGFQILLQQTRNTIYKSMVSIIRHSEASHHPLSVHEPIPARTLNLQILARICLLICDLYLDTLRARPNQGLFP